jgi:hypothetical protein
MGEVQDALLGGGGGGIKIWLIRSLTIRAIYVKRKTEARSPIIATVEKQQVLLIGLCVCVRAWMWLLRRMGVCMRTDACSLSNPARNAYAPYCDVICGPSVCIMFFDIISKTMRFFFKEDVQYKMWVFSTILA